MDAYQPSNTGFQLADSQLLTWDRQLQYAFHLHLSPGLLRTGWFIPVKLSLVVKGTEDPIQHGTSKLGQAIGLLDKVEGYSRIGFTCFVAKGSSWAVSLWEAEAWWHWPLMPYAGRLRRVFCSPSTSRDGLSQALPKAFWYILSLMAIKWYRHRARGKGFARLSNWLQK